MKVIKNNQKLINSLGFKNIALNNDKIELSPYPQD